MSIITQIERSILEVQETPVILDSDVAAFYGVATKRVNEAVANNPDKFPEGYVLTLSEEDGDDLKSKLSTSNVASDFSLRPKISTSKSTTGSGEGRGGRRYAPKAFTEKGLYMLATILKSKKATQTTLSIIEAFAQMRELGRGLKQLQAAGTEAERQPILHRSGEIIADMLGKDLEPQESETTFEVNFAVVKFKHTVKKEQKRAKKVT